jgi:hypothetical protein
MEGSLQEVELRHPHKSKHLDFNSAVNLADDFYMDDDSDLSSQLGKKVGELPNTQGRFLFLLFVLLKRARGSGCRCHKISRNLIIRGDRRKL